MRQREQNVRLVSSERMGRGGSKEHTIIRIPRRARAHFNTAASKLTLRVKQKEEVFDLKQAYKEDVQSLLAAVKSGNISDKQAQITGFVTPKTFNRLVGNIPKKGLEQYCFISDGIENLLVGADPEFALAHPENLRYQYAQYIEGLGGPGDEFGHDGPLAELRPPPATSPSKIVKNINKILRDKAGPAQKFRWFGGATYASPNHPNERVVLMGGHIHIGNPKTLPAGIRNAVHKQIVRVLDEVVAIPLARIDRPDPHLRRNTAWHGYGRYGRWGDQKPQEGRFEWRVPSGLWLVHPSLSRAVLGTTKAVAEECYQIMADNKFSEGWVNARMDRDGFLRTWGVLPMEEASKLLNDSNPKEITAALVNRADKKLKTMESYHKYKDEVDEFLRLVRLSHRDRDNLNLDLKENWLEKGKLISGG